MRCVVSRKHLWLLVVEPDPAFSSLHFMYVPMNSWNIDAGLYKNVYHFNLIWCNNSGDG